MTTPPNPAAGTWKVTSQGAPTTKVDSAGNVTEGITVYFTTGLGTASSVFVPEAVYSTDNVRAMAGAKAAQLDEVSQLAGGPGQ